MEFISITNDPKVAAYFEESGINDIMVDLEILGKKERQKGLNTVVSSHSMKDISLVKESLTTAMCLVRVNPIYERSIDEINEVINRGADIIMLPMFKTAGEVKIFVEAVDNRAKKYLLLETAQALVRVDDILEVEGIDAIHIGLNDLSISMGLDFLYELVIGGVVEYLANRIRAKNIKFGFGGVSRLERGKLLLSEHYRLGSEMVILNRDFRYYKDNYDEIIEVVDMNKEVLKILSYLDSLTKCDKYELEYNKKNLKQEIKNQIKSRSLYTIF